MNHVLVLFAEIVTGSFYIFGLLLPQRFKIWPEVFLWMNVRFLYLNGLDFDNFKCGSNKCSEFEFCM